MITVEEVIKFGEYSRTESDLEKGMLDDTFVLLWNFLFLSVTSSFVFIKPIGRFVDKHIIEKLP